MSSILNLGLVASFVPIFLLLVSLAVTRPRAFITLQILFYASTASVLLDPYYSGISYSLSIAQQYNLTIWDVFGIISAIALAFASAFNPEKYHGDLLTLHNCVSFLAALSLIGVIFWTYLTGIESAVQYWRHTLSSLFVFLYILKFVKNWSTKEVSYLLILCSIPLTILIILRFITTGIGQIDRGFQQSAETTRAASGSGAFLLVLSLLSIRFFHQNTRIFTLLIAPLQIVILLLLQQRTAWICLLIAAFVLIMRDETFSRVNRYTKRTIVFLFTMLSFLTLQKYFLNLESINTYTVEYRFRLWLERVSVERAPLEWVFGSIFGPSPVTDPTIARISAHNAFIDSIEKFGIMGFLVFVLLLYTSYRRVKVVGKERIYVKTLAIFVSVYSITFIPNLLVYAVWALVVSPTIHVKVAKKDFHHTDTSTQLEFSELNSIKKTQEISQEEEKFE